MSITTFSEVLNRKIRKGDLDEQKISTYQRLEEAIGAGRREDAIELADCFIDEAKILYELFPSWAESLKKYLGHQGVTAEEILQIEKGILAPLAFPDRTPFDLAEGWRRILDPHQKVKKQIQDGRREEALSTANLMREQWRQLHDREADWVHGLVSRIGQRLGEEHVEKAWRATLVPFFESRYARFDMTRAEWEKMLDTNLYLACESMRSHLTGPLRDGKFEVIEEDDRWVFSFDPCGTGGRALRGDHVEGTPSRMEPPYNYAFTSKEYPWSWSKKGVCHYCVECGLLMEVMPIEKFGYPVRIVDPPTYPERANEPCRWYVYKDPNKIPEEYFRRLGKTKPAGKLK